MRILYVIPETELLDKGYISDGNKRGKTHLLLYYDYTGDIKTQWAENYMFRYDAIDKDKLLELFNIKNNR